MIIPILAASTAHGFLRPIPAAERIDGWMRALILVVALAAGAAAGDAPSIRVDVNLVNIAFTVRDARGELAGNLNKDDFAVFEDGVQQSVSFFSRSGDLHLSLALVADVSGSQEHFIKQHRSDLQVFLQEALTPRDQAFLLCFGNHLRLVSDFTASPADLLDGLERFDKGKSHFLEIGPVEYRDGGTAFYDALYYATEDKLGKVQGSQRAMIVFSDGEDNSSAHHMLDAIESAQAADVRMFAMRYTQTEHGHLTARNKYGTSVMERIARDSGGMDFDAGAGDVKGIFRQIGEELRASYELAYVSTNPERDGTFRKVRIVPRSEGLKVRAKTGYLAR